MAKFIIKGRKKLEGRIEVKGSKNAVLPLICASLTFEGKTILKNVPQITDVEVMLEILKTMGAEVQRDDSTVIIDSRHLSYTDLITPLISKLRASILFLGPYLLKFGKIKMSLPGGDLIGARPLTTHFQALKELGADLSLQNGIIEGEFKKVKNQRIVLKEISVTASEVLILASALANEEIELRLVALEPHVQALCKFLQKVGFQIKGIGSHYLRFKKGKKLKKEVVFRVPDDYIEASTFLALGAATKSYLEIVNVPLEDLDSVLLIAKEMGINFEIKPSKLIVKPSSLKGTKIQTGYHPKFPTDAQPPFGALATQAEGATLIHDWMYENRFTYLTELNYMGANTELLDPHRALIIGPTYLTGKEIRSLDIRSGVALLIAGLIAEGETVIHEAEKIDRGYEKLDERLNNLGAEIIRVED